MSRGRRAILGFVSDTGGQLLLTFASFALTPLMLRHMSQSQYGFWLTGLSVLAYLGLLELGLGISLTRSVAASLERDPKQLSSIISAGFFLFCIAGIILMLLGLGISNYVPQWFGIPAEDAPAVVMSFRILVIATALGMPGSVFSAVISGMERMAADNIIRSCVAATSLLLSAGLLLSGFGLLALALSTLFTIVVSAVAAAIYAWRLCPGLRLSWGAIDKGTCAGLLRFGGYFQIGKIANTVGVNADMVAISIILGAERLTPYALTFRLASVISNTLASKLPTAVFPAMAQMYASGEFDRMRAAYVRLSGVTTRLGVVGVVVYSLLNHDFVLLWIGSAQYAGGGIMALFCMRLFQETIIRGTASVLFATGGIRAWAYASFVEAILTAGTTVLLVRSFGLPGAALGVFVGRALTASWVIPVLVCRSIRLSAKEYFVDGLLTPLMRSVPSVIFVVLLNSILPTEPSWWKIAVISGVSVAANLLSFEGVTVARSPGGLAGLVAQVRRYVG